MRAALPGLAHLRDRGGLIPAKIPGHAAERAFAPKGPRSAKMRNHRVETGGEAGRGGLKQNGARSSRDGRLLRLTPSDLLTVFG